MHEDNPYMHDDKPYMYGDNPYMYDIIQICMNDKPDIKDDKTDINDDMTDMYEYHIHVWYHVAWGEAMSDIFLRGWISEDDRPSRIDYMIYPTH